MVKGGEKEEGGSVLVFSGKTLQNTPGFFKKKFTKFRGAREGRIYP